MLLVDLGFLIPAIPLLFLALLMPGFPLVALSLSVVLWALMLWFLLPAPLLAFLFLLASIAPALVPGGALLLLPSVLRPMLVLLFPGWPVVLWPCPWWGA